MSVPVCIGPNITHEIMIGEYCPISTPGNFKVEKWAIDKLHQTCIQREFKPTMGGASHEPKFASNWN